MHAEQVTIRRAEPSDADSVRRLARDFATSYALDDAAFDRTYPALLAADDAFVLVAATPELGVAGYLVAHAHRTFYANGPVAWVDEVMVDERARRLGIGRALLTAAEDWARTADARYLALASRRAGPFYQALNYEDSAVFYKKPLT